MTAKSGLPPFGLAAPVSARTLPKGPQWVHEIEQAGRRCATLIEACTVRLPTPGHRDVTRHFHPIAAALLAIRGHEAIIDGEIASKGADRVLESENLQRAIEASAHASLVYIAFDLLFLGGVDLRRWPLLSRKDALRELLRPLTRTCVQYGDDVEGFGDRVRDRSRRWVPTA